MAYGRKNLVTPDSKLHTDDPQVKDAAVKAITKLTTPFKKGYVPPGRQLERCRRQQCLSRQAHRNGF
jgi:hypothetical protein